MTIGRTLGTDAIDIQEAISTVYSDDGVLVLMDMGSAILSAEMAKEFLHSRATGKGSTHLCASCGRRDGRGGPGQSGGFTRCGGESRAGWPGSQAGPGERCCAARAGDHPCPGTPRQRDSGCDDPESAWSASAPSGPAHQNFVGFSCGSADRKSDLQPRADSGAEPGRCRTPSDPRG